MLTPYYNFNITVLKKVKPSRYRHGLTQRVSGS